MLENMPIDNPWIPPSESGFTTLIFFYNFINSHQPTHSLKNWIVFHFWDGNFSRIALNMNVEKINSTLYCFNSSATTEDLVNWGKNDSQFKDDKRFTMKTLKECLFFRSLANFSECKKKTQWTYEIYSLFPACCVCVAFTNSHTHTDWLIYCHFLIILDLMNVSKVPNQRSINFLVVVMWMKLAVSELRLNHT